MNSNENTPTPNPPSRSTKASSKGSKQLDAVGRAKEMVKNFTESTSMTILMSFMTVWALFDDDIRLAATDKDADLTFEVIISIAFFLFVYEFLANCFYKADYLLLPAKEKFFDPSWTVRISNFLTVGSFYFWLDIIATFSLVTEVMHVSFKAF